MTKESDASGRVLIAVVEEVVNSHDELNRLDGLAGDGDLGVTMAAAARAVRASVRCDGESVDLSALLKRCGMRVAKEAPSTSGTLVATGLVAAGRAAGESSLRSAALLSTNGSYVVDRRGRRLRDVPVDALACDRPVLDIQD